MNQKIKLDCKLKELKQKFKFYQLNLEDYNYHIEIQMIYDCFCYTCTEKDITVTYKELLVLHNICVQHTPEEVHIGESYDTDYVTDGDIFYSIRYATLIEDG